MIKPSKPGRANRIEEQIQRDLATMIPKELSDKRIGLVTITGVKITPDYVHATVYFTSIGSTPEASEEALNSASPILYPRIFKLLKIHTVPQLHFVYDKSVEDGFEMDQLIKQARAEDAEKLRSKFCPAEKKGDKIDGVLMLDKPVGLSSNTALQKARRALNAQKAGHTGTLDPFASGLLPLCFGEATKFSADLLHADKEYVASIKFGETTTTADVEGEIIETRPVDFTEEQLHKALESLTGEIDQIPPMYSALKKDGVRLYELARQGQEIEREPRRVTVYELELLSFNKPEALVRVKCSKGTYVRVLGEDIGKILGCGAHLTALRRTKIADIDISEAVSLQDFEEADIAQRLDMLDPPDRLLSQLEPIELKEELAVRFLHGQSIRITRSENSEKKVKVYRLSDGKRELLGCARLSTDGVLSAERLISNSSN